MEITKKNASEERGRGLFNLHAIKCTNLNGHFDIFWWIQIIELTLPLNQGKGHFSITPGIPHTTCSAPLP